MKITNKEVTNPEFFGDFVLTNKRTLMALGFDVTNENWNIMIEDDIIIQLINEEPVEDINHLNTYKIYSNSADVSYDSKFLIYSLIQSL
jgi:hypothetical protein